MIPMKRSGVQIRDTYTPTTPKELQRMQKQHTHTMLRRIGAVLYDLWLPETSTLPLVIQPGETVQGIVYGRYKHDEFSHVLIGRGALIATDQRLILLDKKPFYLRYEEIAYESVTGAMYGKAGPAGTVTVCSRTANISIRTFNQRAAHAFVKALEYNLFSRRPGGVPPSYLSDTRPSIKELHL